MLKKQKKQKKKKRNHCHRQQDQLASKPEKQKHITLFTVQHNPTVLNYLPPAVAAKQNSVSGSELSSPFLVNSIYNGLKIVNLSGGAPCNLHNMENPLSAETLHPGRLKKTMKLHDKKKTEREKHHDERRDFSSRTVYRFYFRRRCKITL